MNDIVDRAAANCAGAYRQWAVRTGHRANVWPDLSASDLGLPSSVPVDSAHALSPLDTAAALHDAVDRAESFFALASGGPIQLWSAWPTPDLSERGYATYRVPGRVRDAEGTAPPPTPPGLTVAPARSVEDLAAASRLVDSVFACSAPDPGSLLAGSVISEDFEVYLGRVAGEPVATAIAYVSEGLCGVYAVATASHARKRGYGEAVSWAATLHRPDLPATLQASPMGLPIYQRMGYRLFGHFTLWEGPTSRMHPSSGQ